MTVGNLLQAVRARAEKGGLPISDYLFLLTDSLGLSSTELLLAKHQDIPPQQLHEINSRLERLEKHEPPQYITGKAWFMGHLIEVCPHVLIPRPETELLVELSLSRLAGQERVLEIGTGSGAIAISLKLAMPGLVITATDISAEALRVAEANATRLGARIDFVQADLFPPTAKGYDAIISNPPYISEPDYHQLPESIRGHEPDIALKAGPDGLNVYRRMLSAASPYLNPAGWIALEHGDEQAEAISALALQHGYGHLLKYLDLNQRPRIMFMWR